ncbi:MAG: hypothetical protein KKA70_08995 [Proteobacteria bacterium]|nr:hypothetical protein [Pseudomonadota bacterium]
MKKVFPLILAALLLFGCAEQKSTSAQELQDSVQTYNRLLSEGYRSLNMTPLARIATPQRTTKAYHHMAALGEGRIRMDTLLDEITFLGSKILADNQNKAEIRTREQWTCNFYNIDTNEKVSDNIITYENVYHLVLEAGRWLVDDISIRKWSETNKKGGLSFFERPADQPKGKAPVKSK